jgi:hypothetical protein
MYAQLLLAALEIYKIHANKPPEWVPKPEDWRALTAEVELATIDKLHAEAKARREAAV